MDMLSRRSFGRTISAALVVGAAAAPAWAFESPKLRKRYLKAANDLERLVKAPPEGLSPEEAPDFEEMQKLLRSTADMLRTAADKMTGDDEALVSTAQEQIAATESRLDMLKKTLSSTLRKTAATADAIIGNLK